MLKKYKTSILTLFLLIQPLQILSHNSEKQSAITYSLHNGSGRFGDKLITYIKAKWLSYKYDIPLYYVPLKHPSFPIPYSDKLMISKLENVYTEKIKMKFNKVVSFACKSPNRIIERGSDKDLDFEKNAGYLYLGYFMPNFYHKKLTLDLEDKTFIQELKRTIKPISAIQPPEIPENRISVALHVRKGGGYDKILQNQEDIADIFKTSTNKELYSYSDYSFPYKFPPDQYYIDQVKKLYELLERKPLHIHIFTDDKTPEKIVNTYKEHLKGLDITFSYRRDDNHYNNNIIEDFFSITYYDCLIRGESNFSLVAGIIGDFFIEIYPEHGYWRNNKLIIDTVKVKINEENRYRVSKLYE